MPAAGLSTGIDSKLTFNDVNGIQRFVIIESFNAKEDATVDKKISMDGVVRHPKFHGGWSGSFMCQRANNFTDNYFAFQEAAYYRGVDQLPMTITQTITEANGSVSQWQWTNVVLVMDDAGTWSGTEVVMQSISFQASRRDPVV